MKNKNQKGITLIEVLVGISILTIMIFGVYGMYNYSLKIVREKGWREQALAVAAEEMESFRSIDYNTLGTAATNCAPDPCSLPPTKTVTKNGVEYTILTDIRHVDDPFDNVGQAPEGDDDTGLNDYKTVRVEVRWGDGSNDESVTFVSTFAPIGIETDCGGGILKLNIFDANAQPVPNAGVYIKNNNLDPVYEYDTRTNDQGYLRIGCLVEDLGNNYEITINKPETAYYNSAYSTTQTCPTGTGTPNPICPTTSPDNTTPTNPHLNIINGETSEKSFAIDLLSTLNIQTITQNVPDEWTVNDTTEDGESQNMPTMGIDQNNNYYFFWQDTRDGSVKIYGQKYNSTKEAQWGADVQVTNNNDRILPNVAVDINGDSYVVWYDQSAGNQEIYIDKLSSSDGSSAWGSDEKFVPNTTDKNDNQSNPKIDLNSDQTSFYLTFLDNSNDTNDTYTTLLSATDASHEWSGEIKVNDDNSGNTQDSPATLVDTDTNDLYVVWQDNRWGDNDIWAQKINSYGFFSKEIKISVESDTENDTTGLNGSIGALNNGFTEENLLYYDPDENIANDSFIFIDEEEGNEIYDGTEIKISVESDTSPDTTNLNNKQLNDGAMKYYDPNPAVANDSYLIGRIHSGGWIHIKISIESDTEADTTSLNNTYKLINGNAIYHDPSAEYNNDSYIFADMNTDNTYDNWGQNILISQYYSSEQTNPAVAISQEDDNKFLYFVWADSQNENYDIYMSKFTNNGVRVWENDINLTTEDTTNSCQTMPAITINPSNNSIYVAWQDRRNGYNDIYMQKFNTSGEKQWVDDFRIEDDLKINGERNPSTINRAPQLAINSLNEVVITWHSDYTGDLDVKAAIVVDPNPTAEPDVPLRIYGSKTIGKDIDENNIYKFDSTFTTDENGELNFDGNDQSKIEWDSYTFEIGAGYNLLLANPSNPISISPDTVNNIVLTVGGSAVCGDPIDYEGASYNTVLIGSQCWMAESLNIGTMTAQTNDQRNDCPSANEIKKYCYNDNEIYCTSDGGLYQWAQATCGATQCNGTGASQPACATPIQGICPNGWHIPSHYEYIMLEREICDSGTCSSDFPYDETTTGWRGTDEGTQLKAGGSSGFEFLFAGNRYPSGSLTSRGTQGYVWSSSGDNYDAWMRRVISGTFYEPMVYQYLSPKLHGYSVRCVQD